MSNLMTTLPVMPIAKGEYQPNEEILKYRVANKLAPKPNLEWK